MPPLTSLLAAALCALSVQCICGVDDTGGHGLGGTVVMVSAGTQSLDSIKTQI